jgi:hypothetical protein
MKIVPEQDSHLILGTKLYSDTHNWGPKKSFIFEQKLLQNANIKQKWLTKYLKNLSMNKIHNSFDV